jgi:hypothetical protein
MNLSSALQHELRQAAAPHFHRDIHIALFRKGRQVQAWRTSHRSCGAAQRRRLRTDAQDKRYLSKVSTGETMREYGLRFLIGGIAVSVFAALGDSLRPKSFAGLFGAAPSIALATLFITLWKDSASFAAIEGRSMMVGAFALAAYSWVVCMLLKRFTMSSWTATTSALAVWFAVA